MAVAVDKLDGGVIVVDSNAGSENTIVTTSRSYMMRRCCY